MADLSTYQQQAASIYDPQYEAERQQAEFRKNSTLTSLGEEERGIEPEYQRALRSLGDQLREGEARLNQLYSQNLGGMFSGLQGNDLGQFFSKGAQQRGDIETDRANKLANIASRRTLAGQEYDTTVGSLTSKYQGLKNQYAQDLYRAALEAEENQRRWEAEQALRQRELNARYAASQPNVNPADEFLSYIADQFNKAGGQGNPNVSRQQQDDWANAWFARKGINSNQDRQFYWDLFNQTYNRSANPFEDWRYQR